MTFPSLTPDEIEASFRDWWKDRYGFESEPFNAVIEWTQFALARHGCTALQSQLAEDPTDDDLLFCYGRAQTDVMATVPKPISLHPENGLVDRLRAAGLRAVLARYGRPTFQPIPVSERLPGPDDCCPNPRNGQGQWCWGWVQPGGMEIPYSGWWRMMRREWLSVEALAWAPWWAFPLPGNHLPVATKMAGEVVATTEVPAKTQPRELVWRIANLLGHYGDGASRAVIREVAEWFRMGVPGHSIPWPDAADALESELAQEGQP